MRIAIILPFVVACFTEHGQTPPGIDPNTGKTTAQVLWETKAVPALEAGDCFTCHASADAIGFLAGADEEQARQTLLASGAVDVDQPAQSALFAKGVHEGSTLTASQTADILEWLDAEGE